MQPKDLQNGVQLRASILINGQRGGRKKGKKKKGICRSSAFSPLSTRPLPLLSFPSSPLLFSLPAQAAFSCCRSALPLPYPPTPSPTHVSCGGFFKVRPTFWHSDKACSAAAAGCMQQINYRPCSPPPAGVIGNPAL